MIMVIGEVLLIVLLLVPADLDPVDRVFLPILHLSTTKMLKDSGQDDYNEILRQA